MKKIMAWKEKFPFTFKDTEDAIQPQYAIRLLWETDQGRGDHHHRRGPAPDVGRAVLRF